jgi:flagellar biosynthesis chaperone FliJ
MSSDAENRARALRTLVRRERLLLETARRQRGQANRRLARADRALRTVEDSVHKLEGMLRTAMHVRATLAVEELQRGREFLAQQHQQRLHRQRERDRLAGEVEQLTERFRTQLLRLRGLEELCTGSEQTVLRERENRGLRDLDELWLQQVARSGS